MKLACQNCATEVDFPNCDLRSVPVELGDAQLFQVRDSRTGSVQHYIFQCGKCGSIRARITGHTSSDWSRQALTTVRVFDDPTGNGQINMRIMKAPADILEHTDMDEQSRLLFFKLSLLCAKKLVAVYKHLQAYKVLEEKLLLKVQQDAAKQAQQGDPHFYIEHAQDLLIEFDEFLVQVKSTLDYLVKVPQAILGKTQWTLSTFGGKGEKVISALENNVPRDKRKTGKAIAAYIIKKHQPWLRQVIEARDKLNHMLGQPVAPEAFMIFAAPREGSGLLEVRRPMWSSDQPVRDFIQIVWDNLIRLVEDFIITFISFRLPPELALFHGPAERGSAESPWRVTTVQEMRRIVAQPGWEALEFR